MRPKIAIVAASLEILGGQGVQARALVEHLRQEGCDVSFIPVNPRFPSWLQWLRASPYIRTVLNQALYLPSLIRMRRVDLVHIFSASYWSFLLAPVPAMLVARAMGKRVILNYHSGEAEDHLARWGRLVHPWLALADEIVVPSDYLRGVFARHGYQSRVIRNIVGLQAFRFRERVPLRPRLLSTRNLEPYYRVENTIKAFALVKPHIPDATLTVAGYGSRERSLRALVSALGVEGVRFAGRVRREDVPSLYDDHDLFVNSSILDNQPLSLLEAFAAGLPVVTTAPGDIPNMIRDGETGLVVAEEDPEAMAKAVISLLEHPDRAFAMALRAREGIERYSWPGVREAWASVYSVTRSSVESSPAGSETRVGLKRF